MARWGRPGFTERPKSRPMATLAQRGRLPRDWPGDRQVSHLRVRGSALAWRLHAGAASPSRCPAEVT